MTPWLTLLLTGALPGVLGQKTDFRCPEEFGYYPHHGDCSLYYVCVFGGPLLESCTGGLVYSQDLQTCDWPRNVPCNIQNNLNDAEAELENINIAIESKKKAKPNNREPRLQIHLPGEEGGRPVLPKKVGGKQQQQAHGQKKDVEAEILRNIDEEVLDALSPQPSIVSVLTHGLARAQNQELTHGLDDVQAPANSLDRQDSRSGSQDGSRGQSFGSREEEARIVEAFKEEEHFVSDTSDLEVALLSAYPGVSKHLDDSHDGVNNDSHDG